MRLVLGHDEAVAEWAAGQFSIVGFTHPYVAMGIVDDQGAIRGAILFNNFSKFNVEVTICGAPCLQRPFIRAAFIYAFRQLGVLRLTCRTRRSNKHVCRILTRLGFKHEGALKHYFGPSRADDAIMYALFPDKAARWIGEANAL